MIGHARGRVIGEGDGEPIYVLPIDSSYESTADSDSGCRDDRGLCFCKAYPEYICMADTVFNPCSNPTN